MTLARAGYEIGRLLAVMSFLILTGSGGSASEPTVSPFSLTHQAVQTMPPDEIKATIKKAIDYRIKQCRNIHYVVEYRSGFCAFGDPVPSVMTQVLANDRVECWANGDSFRVETESRVPTGSEPYYYRCDTYDAETGRNRYHGMKPDGTNKAGAVDSEMQRQPFSAPYIYWLSLPQQYLYFGEGFLGKLVSEFNTWQLRTLPEGLVELTCDFKSPLDTDVTGRAKYELDPVKGFLPVSCYILWKVTKRKETTVFHKYEWRFVVEESTLVSGVWMPTKLREATCVNDERKTSNLQTQTVKTIEIGTTRAADVRAPFPEGTRVQDRFKGIVYVAGPNEEELNPATLYLTPPGQLASGDKDKDQTAELRKAPNERRWLYIAAINVVALSMLAVVFVRRSRARREAPETQDVVAGTDPTPAPAPEHGTH
jgi:hypothetical protein